jgi:hypothetical protein
MPERETIQRARAARRAGKSPSTQAGEFVREEIHHVRAGKHGARSAKQAIAIGLSMARRSGVKLRAPKGRGAVTKRAKRDLAASRRRHAPLTRRSRSMTGALRSEGHSAASRSSLARQSRLAASRRSKSSRSASARHAARTKGPRGRSLAARKAARSRQR